MPKLTEVEDKLLQIESTAFQQFCDDYLYYAEPGSPAIQRSGTQKGKRKTTKGHPDSFYRTSEAKYVLLEYTTQARVGNGKILLKKIKKDILSCLSEEKTQIPFDQIEKIIYCCNSYLAPGLQIEIYNFAQEHGIPIDLKTLDTISQDVDKRFPWLAKTLGLTIDSGQILPIPIFVQEYHSSPFRTSLNIPLIARQTEKADLEQAISSHRVTMVTGPPGVGKTRLVLEVLQEQQAAGLATCYCLSDKHREIFDDLRTFIIDDRPYNLFIDDGNLQTQLLPRVLAFMREQKNCPVHLIITVRDYARMAVEHECAEYEQISIPIGKLQDDDLCQMLKASPFEIAHPWVLDRILDISSGNPRLAVMAARVAIDTNELRSLLDVSDLYDQYFARAIDSSIWQNERQLRVLGLLAFFDVVNFDDKDFGIQFFSNFNLDIETFKTTCQELERLELVESDLRQTAFRIGEQTLGTYFFYRTFVKEPLLDLSLFFRDFFATHSYRFQETITAAFNAFGQKKVTDPIGPVLTRYWEAIRQDEKKVIQFLNIFWYARPDDLLHYVHYKIEQLPPPQTRTYDFDTRITNSNVGLGDPWLALLSKGYIYGWEELGEFLDLSFSYIKKVPAEYPRLRANLENAFIVHQDEESMEFQRQETLINYLSKDNTNEEDGLIPQTFILLAPLLLKTNHQTSFWGRSRDSITIRRYSLRLNKSVSALRSTIWEHLTKILSSESSRLIVFFEEYRRAMIDALPSIYEFDLLYLLPLFKKTLSPDNFEHCCLVQELIDIITRMELAHPDLEQLRKDYSSTTYLLYNHLRIDRLDGVDEYELSIGHQEFQRLKEQEIRNHVSIVDPPAFASFYLQYKSINEWEYSRQRNGLANSLDIVMEQSIRNPTIGLAGFEIIIGDSNSTGYLPIRPFQFICREENIDCYDALYSRIKESDFAWKSEWIQRLLCYTPSKWITAAKADDLINCYLHPGWNGYASYKDWKKYIAAESKMFTRALAAIVKNNESGKSKIRLDSNFFIEEMSKLQDNMPLVEEAYLQQQRLFSPFDLNYAALLAIVRRDQAFLTHFVLFSTENLFRHRDHRGISILWEMESIEDALLHAFDEGLTDTRVYATHAFYPYLFNEIPEKTKNRAYAFLRQYLASNKEDEGKINVVLACVREGLPEHWQEIVLHFLAHNNDPAIFSRLHWTNNSYILGKNKNVSEIKAREYQVLLDVIKGIPGKRYLYAKHKAFLEMKIDELNKRAENDRNTRFMERDS